MSQKLKDTLRELITPAVEAAGYELVELELKNERGWVLRLYIDRLGETLVWGSRISHDDCQHVSRDVSALLDVHDVIPHAFDLEVSSPGLERPLRTEAHFNRFSGRRARVRLKAGVEGRKNFTGTVQGAGEGRLRLEVDGRAVELSINDIDRAQLLWTLADDAAARAARATGTTDMVDRAEAPGPGDEPVIRDGGGEPRHDSAATERGGEKA